MQKSIQAGVFRVEVLEGGHFHSHILVEQHGYDLRPTPPGPRAKLIWPWRLEILVEA